MVQGTFYGNNGWAGACAGLVPLTGQPWPPPGGTYQNSMQPGSSTPFNVAINSAQWSVPMVRSTLSSPVTALAAAVQRGLAAERLRGQHPPASLAAVHGKLACDNHSLETLCCTVRAAADGEGYDHRLHNMWRDSDPESVDAGPCYE